MGFGRDESLAQEIYRHMERDARFARAIFSLARSLIVVGDPDDGLADELYRVTDEMASILVDLGHDDPRQTATWE